MDVETNKDLAKKWQSRIDRARRVHKKEVVDWSEKVIQEYAGDFKTDSDTGERYDQIAQVIHAIEETIQPGLIFNNPKLTVRANLPEWQGREQLVEAVVNNEYRSILPGGRRLETENELCLVDARLLPYGVTKTVYLVEGEILEEKKEESLLDKAKGLFLGSEPEVTETPVITDEKGHITERVDPLKVIIDPDAKHITKIKFVLHELDLEKKDLSLPKYDRKLVEKMKPDVCLDMSAKLDQKTLDNYLKENQDVAGYRVYEIHDLENRQIGTYSEQLKDFIEPFHDYPLKEGSQFNFLYFSEAPNRAYPLPPIKFYRRRAIEFSYIYTQLSRQIDKFMPKLGVDSTKLGPSDKERLKAGNLGAIFETIGPPANAVQEFKFTIQQDLFVYLESIQKLLNLESGSNDYETGSPDDRTATEATYIKQGTAGRRLKPKLKVKQFLTGQANTILLTLMEFQSKERFVKVLGENETEQWWEDPKTGKNTWSKDTISGDYALDLEIESITPVNEALKKKQNTEALQNVMNPALRQGLVMEGVKLKIAPIFEKYASENLGIKDKTKIYENMNIRTPEQEHDIWMNAQVPPVQPDEDHVKHLESHMAWRNSMLVQGLPSEILGGIDKHIMQTQMAVQQKQAKSNPPKPGQVPSGMGMAPEARLEKEALGL